MANLYIVKLLIWLTNYCHLAMKFYIVQKVEIFTSQVQVNIDVA
jgi:hypothetical protein